MGFTISEIQKYLPAGAGGYFCLLQGLHTITLTLLFVVHDDIMSPKQRFDFLSTSAGKFEVDKIP